LIIKAHIIEGCIKQDRKMQFELYKVCYGMLMSVCARYTKSNQEAKELINTIFLKVLTHIDKYQPIYPFEVWIRRIAVNTCIDDFRKNRTHKQMISYIDHHELSNSSFEFDINEAEKVLNTSEIKAAMRELPEMCGKVFNLFAIDGFSHKEVSEMLGMSEGTSKWHVNFARNKLKELLSLKLDKKSLKTILAAAVSVILIIIEKTII
jgi:RNA polymerase sigma-70 factor (ECF subfamily)